MPALAKLLAAAAPAAEPDADLLARFVSTRDDAAFAELVRRHGPAVYGTCRRLVGPAAADDAFQATFLVLAARAGSVRKAASVGSWLVGVAGRVGRRMRVRDQRTEARRQTTDPDQQPAPGRSPDLCLLSSDLCSVLADEFTRLPDRLRAAAVACLVDGHTQDQAAAALGWSARTVRRRLDQAKGLLRARLERRGVTPVAAAAAVGAAGEAAAVPTVLVRRTADGATLFLAGGGADAPAAALAHGVIGAMTTIRSTAAAAVCVAVLAGLGVGWANDTPAPAPVATAEPDRIPPPVPAEGCHTYRTANFVVEAPTEAAARTVGDAFERGRKKSSVEWSGTDLPAWKEPVTVKVAPSPAGQGMPYQAEVRFTALSEPGDGGVFNGTIDAIAGWHAPVLADRFVVHTLLDRRPPWWTQFGLWLLASPDATPTAWSRAAVPARRMLEDGTALRLSAMFRANRPPAGHEMGDQGFALVAFLLSRPVDRRVAVFEGGSIGRADPPPPLAPGQSGARTGLLTFLLIGSGNHWDRAAAVYGFASVDEMERAWVAWVRAQPTPPPTGPADPTRIPPVPPTPPGAGPVLVPGGGAAVHTTRNFRVEAPTAAVARALGDEFERQREEAATAWLGAALPAWKEPVTVRVESQPPGDGYTGLVRFRAVPKAEREGGMSGRLDKLIGRDARWWATDFVLATHLGRHLPRWANDVVAHLDDPAPELAQALRDARRQLEEGQALRLVALFKMTDPPPGAPTAPQALSVVRFLLTRAPLRVVPTPPAGADGVFPTKLEPMSGRQTFTRFLRRGQEAGWETAAREVYGFDSLAQLEAEWVRWARNEPVPPSARPADPDRIPPPSAPPTAPEPSATVRTKNFAVTAPSAVVAQTVADVAEQHRRALAKRWPGAELPDAAEPVPVKVVIAMTGSGGATTFTFGAADGKRPPGVKTAAMELHGPLDAVLKSVLPHEVMHVVLATHFGRPLPRWADEGISVLAESDGEQRNHDIRARELLNAGRAIRLSSLFRMTDYPRDMMVLHAQGYSVCRFLLERGAADPRPGGPPDARPHKTVRYPGGPTGTHEVRFARGDREPALLAFLAIGMGQNTPESWAMAARDVYGFDSLDALEQAWIDWLRTPPARPGPDPGRVPPGGR